MLVTDVMDGPGHGTGSACGSFSITRMMNRSARLPSANTRMLPGRKPRLDSSTGILPMTSPVVFPFRSSTRAVHPHASTTTDRISEPASPAFSATYGHAEMVFSTRAFARRRRWNHHGTEDHRGDSAIAGSGFGGPAAMAAASHPPVTAMTSRHRRARFPGRCRTLPTGALGHRP